MSKPPPSQAPDGPVWPCWRTLPDHEFLIDLPHRETPSLRRELAEWLVERCSIPAFRYLVEALVTAGEPPGVSGSAGRLAKPERHARKAFRQAARDRLVARLALLAPAQQVHELNRLLDAQPADSPARLSLALPAAPSLASLPEPLRRIYTHEAPVAISLQQVEERFLHFFHLPVGKLRKDSLDEELALDLCRRWFGLCPRFRLHPDGPLALQTVASGLLTLGAAFPALMELQSRPGWVLRRFLDRLMCLQRARLERHRSPLDFAQLQSALSEVLPADPADRARCATICAGLFPIAGWHSSRLGHALLELYALDRSRLLRFITTHRTEQGVRGLLAHWKRLHEPGSAWRSRSAIANWHHARLCRAAAGRLDAETTGDQLEQAGLKASAAVGDSFERQRRRLLGPLPPHVRRRRPAPAATPAAG